uniref:Large ribosomal subunit protein mL38 n=1 Tax=Blastobotrys adeninivorans TaxID=409370 RepID=A0A060TCA4_BLAAD
MSRIFTRGVASAAEAASTVVSEQSKASLKIANPVMRRAVMEGEWKIGPPSLKTRKAKRAYYSPIGLKEVFPLALQVLEKNAANHYTEAKKLEDQLARKPNRPDRDAVKDKITHHKVRAELHNPEAVYNHIIKHSDFNEPVYRYLAERDWRSHDLLLLMQRLETLKVIPDTMPTIEPRAHVRLQFPGVVNKWVEPGTVLRNEVAAKRPILTVQEFDEVSEGSLYTVVIVDPDTPDLETDSFKTTLHWAVSNVPLSNVNHEVDANKGNELVGYLPPHPEKNTPTHRYSVWVFRQATPEEAIRKIDVDQTDVARERFDIRAFADKYGLTAVGAHVFRVNYDRSTDSVREKFGLGPGMVYSRVRRGVHKDQL